MLNQTLFEGINFLIELRLGILLLDKFCLQSLFCLVELFDLLLQLYDFSLIGSLLLNQNIRIHCFFGYLVLEIADSPFISLIKLFQGFQLLVMVIVQVSDKLTLLIKILHQFLLFIG